MRLRYLLLGLVIIFGLNEYAFARHHSRHAAKKKRVYMKAIAPAIYGTNQLRDELNAILRGTNATVGVYVKSMQQGDALFSYNVNQPLTPASTMKVLTAEAALLYLGADYRFSTQLLTDAKTVSNGVLQGNLYIVLSGDPTLTTFDVAQLLLSLHDEQVTAIAGNVYIDNTAYDQSFYGPGWVWQDKNYCYAAPISASIINHNCLAYRPALPPFNKKSAGIPDKKSSSKRLRRTANKSKSNRYCTLRLADGSISIDGCIPRGDYSTAVSNVVTDIPEYNRALFKTLLSRLNVRVLGYVTFRSAPTSLSLVGVHHSEQLRVLLTEMLKKSDNIIAGAVFKKLGQLYAREPGSWANGSLAVSQILKQQTGMGLAGLRILDGSGLSPNNLATPAQMMQALEYAYRHQTIRSDFISALPVAGVDGTLKHRLGNVARKVRAKTGTISGVVSLAGYAQAYNQEPLAFVVMVNGSRGMVWRYRALEDKIVTALTHYRRG